MANLHEIKARIANVNATKKITRAMYLISASKSQRAKSQLEAAFPYFQQIRATLAEILACSEDLDTPYIAKEAEPGADPPRRDLYVVMGGDKGMAGSYNNNLLAVVEQHVQKECDELLVAGFMCRTQLRHQGFMVSDTVSCPVMNPNVYRARDVADQVVEMYLSGQYRAVYVVFTEMVTSLKQEPRLLQLLPLDVAALCEDAPPQCDEIEYLPSAHQVFDHLVPYYLKGVLYSAFVEAFASEQHARMYAMDGATKSANDTIGRLSISYNRARQAKITQELTEIIGGIPEE